MSEPYKIVNLDLSPASDYKSLERQRLAASELRDDKFYELWMRLHKNETWVFRGIVKLESLARQAGHVACSTVLLDPDMQPAFKMQSSVEDDYWIPNNPLLIQKEDIDDSTRIGFFAPYESEQDSELWRVVQELSVPVGRL